MPSRARRGRRVHQSIDPRTRLTHRARQAREGGEEGKGEGEGEGSGSSGGEGGGEGGGGEGGGEGGDGHGSLHTSRLLAAEEKVHVVLVVGG